VALNRKVAGTIDSIRVWRGPLRSSCHSGSAIRDGGTDRTLVLPKKSNRIGLKKRAQSFQMSASMASPTERDEIFFRIVAKPTSRRNVVNF
jgi:hypothetical protein